MVEDVECDLTALRIYKDSISFGRYERKNGEYVKIIVWRDKNDGEIYPTIYSEDKDGNEIGMPLDEYMDYVKLAYKEAKIAKQIWSMES